jgi:bleomycin hydrolase
MKKLLFCLLGLSISLHSVAQKYEFQTLKDIEATPVISQDQTGTCWSFSTTSFLEAEIIRLTGKKIDLSEMFTVRNIYLDKADNYVSRQGKCQFSEGGLAHDVINSAKKYGVVPFESYTGKINATEKYNHAKMVEALEQIVKKAVADTPKKYPNWKADYLAVLDQYMGKPDLKGVNPQSYLATTKLKLQEYVTITSFTHEPYYSKFILNIPDNFSNGSFYNLPLEEYVQNIDNALAKGYTIAIDADVSEATFSGKIGIAVVPEKEEDAKAILTEIKPEKTITAEYRQVAFENYDTQDDHLMHIVGKVKDQNGTIYYKVKNSWGTQAGKEGFVYMSGAYLRLKSISVLMHKDALTKKTKSALGI